MSKEIKIEYNTQNMANALHRLDQLQNDWQSYHFPEWREVGCGNTTDQERAIYDNYKAMYDEMIHLVIETKTFMKKLDDNYVEADKSIADNLKN